MRRRRSSLATVPRLEVQDLLQEVRLRLPPQPGAQTRRRRSSLTTVPRLEVQDLLEDILLRLPPQLAICKQWRSIFSNPQFLRRFRKHHRKAPLLGFFVGGNFSTNHVFTPVLDAPDRIPAARFPLPWSRSLHERWNFIGCRHGLAVLISETRREIIVWDPLTDRQRRVAFPPGLDGDNGKRYWHAALLCDDPEDGHVHGDCFLSPFKLVVLCIEYAKAFRLPLRISASGVWGDVVSTATTETVCLLRPNILVGNTLCWVLGWIILEFDFERKTLAVIRKPVDVTENDYWSGQLLRREDSGLGLAVLSELVQGVRWKWMDLKLQICEIRHYGLTRGVPTNWLEQDDVECSACI